MVTLSSVEDDGLGGDFGPCESESEARRHVVDAAPLSPIRQRVRRPLLHDLIQFAGLTNSSSRTPHASANLAQLFE